MKTERFTAVKRSVLYEYHRICVRRSFMLYCSEIRMKQFRGSRRLFVQRELLGECQNACGNLVLLLIVVIDAVCNAVRDDLHLFHAHAAGRSGRVPRRTPEVMNGLRFSPGTVFLLAVM